MKKEVIFAENQGIWISYNPDDVIFHIKEIFDDYPNRRWFEKGIYYDYDLMLYKSKTTGKSAIIISFWEYSGKVMGCPDCAMIKQWAVFDYDTEENESDSAEFDNDKIRIALNDSKPVLPIKIFRGFCNKLKESFGINPYKDEDIKNI